LRVTARPSILTPEPSSGRGRSNVVEDITRMLESFGAGDPPALDGLIVEVRYFDALERPD